ncbi:unnamed protein product [Periconia digitata]|uniref:Uncharacterized protein n=1 Tax=Periconia digitata TaxID=1303443 RepID=A0A9W4UTM4_9PLEO|nr:unnamed protein product [Periconia digitata]
MRGIVLGLLVCFSVLYIVLVLVFLFFCFLFFYFVSFRILLICLFWEGFACSLFP